MSDSVSGSGTTSNISQTATRLIRRIQEYQSVAVAFSGGVDSAVVARAAAEGLGDKSLAVTAVSPSLATAERETARAVAKEIGIRHVEISTHEFERPEYVANTGDRCFFCKQTLYSLTQAQLEQLGVACIINGANCDDTSDHRPGMRAAKDFHVRSPLIELGLTKADVRALAHFWKLSVADKPASPCLSSRIAYGVEVTPERVWRVEQAEAFLRSKLGNINLRVRLEAGEVARIEVPLADLHKLTVAETAAELADSLRSFGFRRVTLDLDGFRSGNLNQQLPIVDLQPGDLNTRITSTTCQQS